MAILAHAAVVLGLIIVARWHFSDTTLGLAMATLVALIAFLTLRFSVNYMHREAGFQRFFM